MTNGPPVESARIIREVGEKTARLMLIINGQRYEWPIAQKRIAELLSSARPESI